MLLIAFATAPLPSISQNSIGASKLPPSIYTSTENLLRDLELPKNSDNNLASWARAFGYIMAIYDESTYETANFTEVFRKDPKIISATQDKNFRSSLAANFTCIEPNVSAHQIESLVINFLRNNPSTWNSRAHLIVKKALKEGFPCSPEKFKPREINTPDIPKH